MIFFLAMQLLGISFISIFFLMVLGGIESTAIRIFSPSIFERGIKVYEHTVELTEPYHLPELGKIINMDEGKFKFVTDNKVYFISQFFWFKPFRIDTPFQLNGTGIIDKDKIVITAKLPITRFFFALALAMSGITVLYLFYFFSENIWYSLFSFVVFTTIFFFFREAFLVEKERIKIMINELTRIISTKEIN